MQIKRVAPLVVVSLSLSLVGATLSWGAPKGAKGRDEGEVKAEHGMIGLGQEKDTGHTSNPEAQWYPDAGLGLFLHWSICSVREMNISWPMIPGRPLAAKRIEDAGERERIIREGDWNLNGRPNEITPNEYWSMAEKFNPSAYDPDKWMKAVKAAGFTYVVLTTRHHDGFAMWPSKYGDFSTKNYMGGRDLVKEYVEACRRNGLKVGLYYSPPNWRFDRDYMTFLYHGAVKKNPEFPSLDADLKPRTTKHSEEEVKKHQAEFTELVRGQVEELLTNYGKIDLLWFDGKPPVPNGENVISLERIRQLQPGIVVNPRLHGRGDFVTFERTLKIDEPVKGWAEFCNTWQSNWSYTKTPFKADGYVLGQLARSRSLGVNYLLGIGPMANGDLSEDEYRHMGVVAEWMKKNGEAVHAVRPLPKGEVASVPGVMRGATRYLYLIPTFEGGKTGEGDMVAPGDEVVTIKGVGKPASVKLMGDGSELEYSVDGDGVSVKVPAGKRTKLVDVVQIELPGSAPAADAK